jgi:hypothetical protein
MSERHRHGEHEDVLRYDSAGGPPDSGSGLGQIRSEARDLLRAADDAIHRVLSGDSEDFLRSVRQRGGQ